MSTPPKEYILGTGSDELTRLALQHRIWADAAVGAWKRAGIGPGKRVLDVGCGPGYATVDLAQLVTHRGWVVGVDESESFLEFLNTRAKAAGLTQIQTRLGDAQNLSSFFDSQEKFDAIYCRWVLCWLPSPEQALLEMRKLLKPGGKLVIHDYFNWKAMRSAPDSPAIEKMIQAALASFLERQGNSDIAADLPALFRKTGFEFIDFTPHARVARGGGKDSTLEWILDWWRTYGPKLVQAGKLSPEDHKKAQEDLNLIETDSDRFFFCPPVFELIAETK